MSETLSTEAAKARLKKLAPALEVASWVRNRPFAALLVAAAAGGVAARIPGNLFLTFLDVLMEMGSSEDETKEDETP